MMAYRRHIRINGIKKKYSHFVWHENTSHWPVDNEVIHHIDGDSANDSFSNLQLMSISEHHSLHKHSKENKAKISIAQMGEKNHRWLGDAASPKTKYMRAWRAKRRMERIE